MRVAACALATALALPAWLAVSAWLGGLEQHPARLGGRFGFGAYLLHFAAGIDRNTGPQLLGIPLLVLLTAALARAGPPVAGGGVRLGRAALLFTAAASLALLALFNLTWIHDKPENRFTLFVTLILGGLGAIELPALLGRRWAVLALALLLAEPGLRAAKNAVRGRGPQGADYRSASLEGFAPGAATIDPGWVARAPEPIGGLVRVSPPSPSTARFSD